MTFEQIPSHSQSSPVDAEALKYDPFHIHARKKGFRAVVALTAGVASYFPVSTFAYNADYLYGTRDSTAPAIDDCQSPNLEELRPGTPEGNWNPPKELAKELDDIEAKSHNVTSAAGKFRPIPQSPNRSSEQEDILLVPWNFNHEITRFTMESSGIDIRILTNDEDSGITVNPQAVEKIFNEPMEKWYVFTDKSLRDLFYCAKQDLLTNKIKAPNKENNFTQTTINVYLPSKPNYCIRYFHAISFTTHEERKSLCKNTGFNVPNIDFGLFDSFFEPHIVFVTGRNTNPMIGSEQVTQTLSHELAGHEIVRIMKAKPYLGDDEKLAVLIEDQLSATRDYRLENAFIYPFKKD